MRLLIARSTCLLRMNKLKKYKREALFLPGSVIFKQVSTSLSGERISSIYFLLTHESITSFIFGKRSWPLRYPKRSLRMIPKYTALALNRPLVEYCSSTKRSVNVFRLIPNVLRMARVACLSSLGRSRSFGNSSQRLLAILRSTAPSVTNHIIGKIIAKARWHILTKSFK